MSLEPVSHFFYSHRLKLQFWDWGTDGKPVLILVHGGLDHARNWDWVARALYRDYPRVCAGSARPWQQRVGSRSAVQRGRTCAGFVRAGRHRPRISGDDYGAFAGRGGDAAVRGRVSRSRQEGGRDRRRGTAACAQIGGAAAGRSHPGLDRASSRRGDIARPTVIRTWLRPWSA